MADQTDGTKIPFSLSATYASPAHQPFSLTQSIPPPPSSSVADKTAYLNALREATAAAQEKINQELTARMDEDKARDSAAAGPAAAKTAAVDEAKEEENYGEEIIEEE
jgi:hypothetical protein